MVAVSVDPRIEVGLARLCFAVGQLGLAVVVAPRGRLVVGAAVDGLALGEAVLQQFALVAAVLVRCEVGVGVALVHCELVAVEVVHALNVLDQWHTVVAQWSVFQYVVVVVAEVVALHLDLAAVVVAEVVALPLDLAAVVVAEVVALPLDLAVVVVAEVVALSPDLAAVVVAVLVDIVVLVAGVVGWHTRYILVPLVVGLGGVAVRVHRYESPSQTAKMPR